MRRTICVRVLNLSVSEIGILLEIEKLATMGDDFSKTSVGDLWL